MTLTEGWGILFLCGALGSIAKDIIIDNKIKIPAYKGGELYLGCIGGMIIGALAGYLVDNDPVTAFLGGYSGKQIIESLVNNKERKETIKKTESEVK